MDLIDKIREEAYNHAKTQAKNKTTEDINKTVEVVNNILTRFKDVPPWMVEDVKWLIYQVQYQIKLQKGENIEETFFEKTDLEIIS